MSMLLGTKRSSLGSTSFGWKPGSVDFSSTSIVPAPGQAGDSMNLAKAESSLAKVAVWSCVDLTASSAETLPLDVYSGEGQDKRPRPLPGWLADLSGDGYGIHDWIHQAIYSGMLRGNLFGNVLERDNRGNPRQIALYHPDGISQRPDSQGRRVWYYCGQPVEDGALWHRRFNAIPGYMLGLSAIALHVLTVGTGLQAMQFGFDWFRDGAHPSAILSTDSQLSPDKAQEAKKRFMEALRGRREPAVLGLGWKYQTIQIAPNESQFLETNEYTSAECCRIFGPGYAEVLGYKTGGSLTYVNREERATDMLTWSLDKWFVRIERILSALLPAPQFVKLNRAALLRTDLLTRYKAYNVGIASHFLLPDEARDNEDLQPLTPEQKAELTAIQPSSTVPFDQSGAKI